MSENDAPSEVNRRGIRWLLYVVIAGIAVGQCAATILRSRPLLSANDRSRWCTVWSLAEKGTYQIDEIITRPGWDTIDKVRYQGHFYSSKPALLPALIAGVYRCGRWVFGWDLISRTEPTTRAILLVVNLAPWIAFLIIMAATVERYADTDICRFFVIAAAAFGTLLTPFLATLNNHTLAAASVLFALYPMLRILVDGKRSVHLFAAAGFFAAFACTNELFAAPFGLAAFGLLWAKAPKRTFWSFLPAALIPLAAFFVTTYVQTGSWKPFYLYFGTELYRYVHEGIPSYWLHPRGVDKAVDPPLVYFIHSTVGHHGVFSLSPVFLLSLIGWMKPARREGSPLRLFLWLGAGLTACFFVMLLTKTGHYNYGGVSCGLRWSLWLVPLWLVAIIPAMDQIGRRIWFRLAACGMLAVSVFSATYPMGNPWQQPWLFALLSNAGWVDYRDEPPKLTHPQHTWIGDLAEITEPGQQDWIEFAGDLPDGAVVRMRLSDGGRETVDGRTLAKLDVVWSPTAPESGLSRSNTYYIDVESFRTGNPPERFLRWPGSQTTEKQRRTDISFVRGLPTPREYQPGFLRYLKTSLRPEAYECQHVASQVYDSPEGESRRLLYRCDAWLCPEVPFGVLQVQKTVLEPDTGVIVFRLSLTAVDASHESPGARN